MSKVIQFIAIILVGFGVYISWYFFRELSNEYTVFGKNEIIVDKTGQVGDFIGGVVGTIFSLSAFILLLVTLWNQNKFSYIQQFESKFFDLLKIHRENVNDIKIDKRVRNPKTRKIEMYSFEKRKAFKAILSEFINCRNELKRLFKQNNLSNIYEDSYLIEVATMLNVDLNHIRLKSLAKVNISYCIVFYGVGSEGFSILKNVFSGKYKEEFITQVLNYVKMKPIESHDYWNRWLRLKAIKPLSKRLENIKSIHKARKSKALQNQFPFGDADTDIYYDDEYIKYYGGHQHRLSHYFRHLYQTVKLVNTQDRLSFKEKYFYIKTLRSQISTYEQALLFINSVSILGYSWEFNPDFERSRFAFINTMRSNEAKLITKYNLIKNLPGEEIIGIGYTFYYPNVKYDFLNP